MAHDLSQNRSPEKINSKAGPAVKESAGVSNTLDEKALIEKAKQGNFEAFEEIVNRLEGRVYHLALGLVRVREDAEDVTQETFISVSRNLTSFRGDSSLFSWVARIATNHALKLIRKRRDGKTVSLDFESSDDENGKPLPHPEVVADWKESPREILARKESRQIIQNSLDQIDDKYRMVFVLRDMQNLSVSETAEALGLSISNVKIRLMRARLMLREKLTNVFGDMGKSVNMSNHRHE